ncbi:hypothetical protein [Microvirga tunisiensis]|jgi:hypothetical protein|uniref:Uncharacterized protein n=1 Tax=Microvirga tunisiensis TaxID=2108360 RepID=A0A5N7MS68_9HYPH|nr:hypothetical protein [Microvirga tunisiensis]MPR11802.1 hypothetical protein [Microvirga tunisiensis]MPR29835.1 hypothetical protein [Microvirga tunisiensis]
MPAHLHQNCLGLVLRGQNITPGWTNSKKVTWEAVAFHPLFDIGKLGFRKQVVPFRVLNVPIAPPLQGIALEMGSGVSLDGAASLVRKIVFGAHAGTYQGNEKTGSRGFLR